MGIKKYKPSTPGRRHATVVDFSDITTERPYKPLCTPLVTHGGRNNQGKVTVRHRGGGVKRLYRSIDFKRDKDNMFARVMTIEYDPNRSARIALLEYQDGQKRYILAPDGLKKGDRVISGEHAAIKTGNALVLHKIPVGTFIHNLELNPGSGAVLIRSAGGVGQIIGKEKEYVSVRLPSGQIRLVHEKCRATIGQLSNLDHSNISLGKAGRKRYLGIKPTVRGTAMSPRDHPHGGGEGRQPEGMSPKTPWGKPARGKKTRFNKRTSRFIVHKHSTAV